MITPATSRVLLLALWIAILGAFAWFVQRTLVVGTDLRLFMPRPSNAEQRFLIEEIGESPGSRLLLLAIEGDTPATLAQLSNRLLDALAADSQFAFVANGNSERNQVPESLLPYRYLLTDAATRGAFAPQALRAALQERLQDLASPAAATIETWIERDPTLETLRLLEQWVPGKEPNRSYDVWFDSSGLAALLVAETSAAAFDPDAQVLASRALQEHFAAIRAASPARLIVSGPGAFSVLMQQRTRSEAEWLGTVATGAMALLLLFAYRSWRLVLLGLLPLVSAALAGLLAVTSMFGTIHGITLAFGFTLLGVAQDYPLHLFSHRRPGASALQTARRVWPPLATGVASTCVAYLAFLASGVLGLAQLACFTVAGLAAAGLTTRFCLPYLLAEVSRDYGDSPWLARGWAALQRWPHPQWLLLLVPAVALIAMWFGRAPLWENDLSKLTPVPAPLLQQDARLRQDLGAPDVRYLLVLRATTADGVLQGSERLARRLTDLVDEGVIGGFDHPARYLPSLAVQEQRRAALPNAKALEQTLAAATQGLPFAADAFAPFIADVQAARIAPALQLATLRNSPLELRVASLLFQRDNAWIGLITFTDVRNRERLLASFAADTDELVLIDLKRAAETLVARQRTQILWSLLASALLLLLVVAIALRRPTRVARVLLPMALTTLLILGLLQMLGISLSLFHLIALVLAAGLGLDYALFFEHADADRAEQQRTLHAVLVCAASTLMVFALLATSTVPVLRSIGVTVTIGVASNFLLALLLTRPRATA
jgi:predicted exporter